MKSEAVSNLFITFQSSSSVSSYVLPKISYTRQIILVIWKQRFEIFQERSQKVPLLLATSPLALLDRGIFYCVNQIFFEASEKGLIGRTRGYVYGGNHCGSLVSCRRCLQPTNGNQRFYVITYSAQRLFSIFHHKLGDILNACFTDTISIQ